MKVGKLPSDPLLLYYEPAVKLNFPPDPGNCLVPNLESFLPVARTPYEEGLCTLHSSSIGSIFTLITNSSSLDPRPETLFPIQ